MAGDVVAEALDQEEAAEKAMKSCRRAPERKVST